MRLGARCGRGRIADSFVPVHEQWGTADKVTVIPNWAPLDEIVPVERKNDWAVEHELDDTLTLLYSGTLGLKHNPALLVGLAHAGLRGRPRRPSWSSSARAPAGDVLRAEAERLDVPLTLLPFQPYDRLSEVLGRGDILVVLLEQDAGAFSVPSKTLSYLCAGRPVLGLMPSENLAAQLIDEVGGCVLPPAGSLPRRAPPLGQRPARRPRAPRRDRAWPHATWPSASSHSRPAPDRFERILVGSGA